MSDAIRALLVDDNRDDLVFAERLSRGGLECSSIRATSSADRLRELLDERIAHDKPSIVFLDYRLDDSPIDEDGTRADYRGGTIAAELKERHPEVAVVLLTTEEKLHAWLDGSPRVKDLFDATVLKSALTSPSREGVAAEMEDLGRGYKALATAFRKKSPADPWDRLRLLMRATPSEGPSIRALGTGEAPDNLGDAASWLLRQALRWPGPLIDQYEAAAKLGIEKSSFDAVREHTLLTATQYEGAFGIYLPRWWRGRLEKQLRSIAGKDAAGAASRRAAALAERTGAPMTAAHCAWCEGEFADRSCSLCRQAVDQSHCLPATLDERPAWADRAVVCFRCIVRGDAEHVAFSSGSTSMVAQLRAGAVRVVRIDEP